MTEPRDPVLHTFITDSLPDDHPLAWESVACVACGGACHAVNNETMDNWFETGKGPHCWDCFIRLFDYDDESWAL